MSQLSIRDYLVIRAKLSYFKRRKRPAECSDTRHEQAACTDPPKRNLTNEVRQEFREAQRLGGKR